MRPARGNRETEPVSALRHLRSRASRRPAALRAVRGGLLGVVLVLGVAQVVMHVMLGGHGTHTPAG